ncbi:MAG: hypothetical protein WD972_02570, partial [Candidatus Andersenbacteria bacterium]
KTDDNFLIQTAVNSTTAFQIQNAAGTSNLLIADTTNTRIGIGATPANSLLTIGTNTTTAAGGITFGTDTNLYRSAANLLRTDDSFNVNGQLQIAASDGGLLWGGDTTLYRPFANTLRTDDSFHVNVQSNAANSFDVTNDVGQSVLTVNTINNQVLLPRATAASSALVLGGDTNLYRSAADTLKTDDSLVVGANYDQSSSSGTFKTGTGAVSLNGDTTLASGKTFKIGTTQERVFTTSLPTTVGDYIEIFGFANPSDAFSFDITVNTEGGLGITSETKHYIFSDNFSSGLGNYTVTPIDTSKQGGFESTSDFELEYIRDGAPPNDSRLRIRRTVGTAERGITVAVRMTSHSSISLNALSGTGVSSGVGNQRALAFAASTGGLNIGALANGALLAKLLVNGTSASLVGQVIRGAALQSADLLQLQDSAGSILAAFQSDGKLAFGPSGSQDTNLYRSAADTLKTDDNFFIQTATNSTTAFQVQNAAGTSNLLVADTTNTRIGIGATPANSLLTIGTNTTTAAGGITFGTDTNLYRSAAGTLKTIGSLQVDGLLTGNGNAAFTGYVTASTQFGLSADSTLTAFSASQSAANVLLDNKLLATDSQRALRIFGNGKMEWGAGGALPIDTNLYRSAADTLKTDDSVIVVGSLDAGTLLQGGTGVLLTSSSFGGDVSGLYTNLQLGTGVVTASEIFDGTIMNADISASASISVSKLTAGSNGQVLGVVAGVPAWIDSGVPAGAVNYFNLAACPTGWTELTGARGRYLVGLPASGTLAGTGGTALTNLENRAVGQHNHTASDSGHSHYVNTWNPDTTGANRPDQPDPAAGVGITSATGYANITVANAGSVAGTNAPFLQLLVCQKS